MTEKTSNKAFEQRVLAILRDFEERLLRLEKARGGHEKMFGAMLETLTGQQRVVEDLCNGEILENPPILPLTIH